MSNPPPLPDLHSPAFKQEVALAALSSGKTVQQIAAEYNLPPDLVAEWKQMVQEAIAGGLRSNNRQKAKRESKESARLEAKAARMEQLLAQRERELAWLTEKSKDLGV